MIKHMLKNLRVENETCSFEMHSKFLSLANSIRRALVSDIETYAPSSVVFHTNTSCQTDEYLAHRIGLIPFTLDVSDDCNQERCVHINVSGTTATTKDMKGNMISAYQMDIIKLIQNQTLHATVNFTKGTGSAHARFSPVASPGYKIAGNKIHFHFESTNGENPLLHLEKAIKALSGRIENTRYQVESTT